MTKKRNLTLRLATSIVLVMTLCLSMVQSVLAAPVTGTEQNAAKAAITKEFKMGESITTPEVTFSFAFNSESVNDELGTADNMPEIGNKTVSFSAVDAGITDNGVKTIYKETQSLFDEVTWPHAGVYVYTVSEVQGVTKPLGQGESIEYSQEKYKITVYVANGTKGLYIAAIGAEITVTDGEEGTEESLKVNGEPGGDPNIAGDHSKIIFTNTYMKNNGTGNPKDHTLIISKKVTTANVTEHDFANQTMYFDFQVTVSKSNANTNALQKYKAYVLNENGDVVTSDKHYDDTLFTDALYGQYIEFTAGEQATIHLKHGEQLSFVDLEVDATYTVTELGTAKFTPSCTQTINGKANTLPGDLNASLTVMSTKITEGDDRADFLNTYVPMIPVGIKVDDMPYIVLILLGLSTFILFAAFKHHKRDKENA